MNKKLGLALGSGGSRGVAHIGFLQALEEVGVTPDYITGISMGAVVGAAYASGMTIEQMKEAVYELRLLDLVDITGKRGGLMGTKKMREVLEKCIGDIQFSDLKIPFRCYAVDMVAQELVEFFEGSVLDAVVASACIPGVFHPFEKNGTHYIDGGILERVPVTYVKEMGADVLVAVDVLGRRSSSKDVPNVLKVVLEMIDIIDNQRTARRREKYKDIIDFWLEPDLGDMSQYDIKPVEFAYEKGYEMGKEHANNIRKALKRPYAPLRKPRAETTLERAIDEELSED